jgi:hypothetical protein
MSGRKERREAGSLSQFYVFSAFSAANQLVEAESAAKIAKKKAHRPVDVPLLLAYNVTIVVVEGVCC